MTMRSIHVSFFKERCQRSATDSIPKLWMKSHAATMHEWVPRVAWRKSLDFHGFYTSSESPEWRGKSYSLRQRSATDSIPKLWMKSHAATMHEWVPEWRGKSYSLSKRSATDLILKLWMKSHAATMHGVSPWNPSNMVRIYTCLCISSCTLW